MESGGVGGKELGGVGGGGGISGARCSSIDVEHPVPLYPKRQKHAPSKQSAPAELHAGEHCSVLRGGGGGKGGIISGSVRPCRMFVPEILLKTCK